MTDDPDFLARSLVRSYSDTLKNNQANDHNGRRPSQRMIEEALCEEVEQQDALAKLLQQAASDQDREASNKLRARYEELETAFKEFRNAFPELEKETGSWKAVSWPSLRQVVSNFRTQHDAKSKKTVAGQAKRHFHRICEVIDNHSNVLKILPQGDKYTSLVCGSLEMIVKASVNHEKIGQDFSIALEEIDEIVADVRHELALYQAPHLKDQSIRLCCKILAFMTFPLRWYSQKRRTRLLSSFNENLSNEYQVFIAEIRRISDHIRRGVQICTAREVRSILGLVKYHHDSREMYQRENWKMNESDWEMFHSANEEHNRGLRTDGQKYLSNMSQAFGNMFGGGIGQPMKQILDREAENFVNLTREGTPVNARLNLAQTLDESVDDFNREPSPKVSYERSEVEKASEVLNPFFDFDQIAVKSSEINNFIEVEAIQRLQSWTEKKTPGLLGVFGPASYDSSTKLLASNYVQAAKASGIPCISYFCETGNDRPPEGRLRETVGLVALLYALMKQLILHLPRQVDTKDTSLDLRDFKDIDGTLRTWASAMAIFKGLLHLTDPPFLLISIHGIEMLEHLATEKYLVELIGVLKGLTLSRESEATHTKVLKVLLTTCGISQVLSAQLNEDDVLDLNRGSATHRSGQAKKGRQSMAYLACD